MFSGDDAVQDFAADDAIVGAELKNLGDAVLLAVGVAVIDDRQLARFAVPEDPDHVEAQQADAAERQLPVRAQCVPLTVVPTLAAPVGW